MARSSGCPRSSAARTRSTRCAGRGAGKAPGRCPSRAARSTSPTTASGSGSRTRTEGGSAGQFYLSRTWLPAITSHKPRSAGGSSAVFGFFRTMLDGGLIFFYIRTHLVLFHFPLDWSVLIKHMFSYQFASSSVLDFLPRG